MKARTIPYTIVASLMLSGAALERPSAGQCDLGYLDAEFAKALGFVNSTQYELSLNSIWWNKTSSTMFYWGNSPNSGQRLYLTAGHNTHADQAIEDDGIAIRRLQTLRIIYDGCPCFWGFANDTSVDLRITRPSKNIYPNTPIFYGRSDPSGYGIINNQMRFTNNTDISVKTPNTFLLDVFNEPQPLKLDFYPVAAGERVWHAGYPRPSQSPWVIEDGLHYTFTDENCQELKIKEVRNRTIELEGTTSGGLSGSPLFRASSGGVVGVMVGVDTVTGAPVAHSVREILLALQQNYSNWTDYVPSTGYVVDPNKPELPLPILYP